VRDLRTSDSRGSFGRRREVSPGREGRDGGNRVDEGIADLPPATGDSRARDPTGEASRGGCVRQYPSQREPSLGGTRSSPSRTFNQEKPVFRGPGSLQGSRELPHSRALIAHFHVSTTASLTSRARVGRERTGGERFRCCLPLCNLKTGPEYGGGPQSSHLRTPRAGRRCPQCPHPNAIPQDALLGGSQPSAR
jgi:hypothetical protein